MSFSLPQEHDHLKLGNDVDQNTGREHLGMVLAAKAAQKFWLVRKHGYVISTKIERWILLCRFGHRRSDAFYEFPIFGNFKPPPLAKIRSN